MNRRTCLIGLGAIGTAALAGCLGGGGGDSDGDNGDNGGGSGLALVEHDFNRPEGTDSPEFTATVENNTNERQTINIQLTVNSGDSLADDASFTTNVEPGEMGSGSAVLIGLENPGDITDYVIALSEGLFSDPTVEREFSGDEFRERLDG